MTRARSIGLVAGGAFFVAFLVAVAFFVGRHSVRPAEPSMPAPADAAKKILYWHDPMVPGQRFDQPGKSPFMDMQLVPVYADAGPAAGGVEISGAVRQNLGIRYANVRREPVASGFEAIGTVQFDERLVVAVQTRVAGYVERLAVRAPMERVRKGQALATVFAPDWLGPLNELVALERSGVSDDLIAVANDRIKAMSIPAELVRRAEATGTAEARYTLVAPASGVVVELGVREGVAVASGTTLFRIAGLEKVWAVVDIPEAEAVRFAPGRTVRAVLQADPSQTFDGRLTEILPGVSATTRTQQARFEVDNRSGTLTPGMLLRVVVSGPESARLTVPSEAVIRTGKRTVVIVRNDRGAFEPREVSTGIDGGERVEIVQGLSDGEQVVASGQFLIDSEARLRSVLGNMTPDSSPAATIEPPPTAEAVRHVGEGKVESVAPDSITISHGPIPSLKWPAMTMEFAKPDVGGLPGVAVGDAIRFTFVEGGATGYRLVAVRPLVAKASK